GIAKGNLPIHKNQSFRVVGILKSTGTPVDKSAHISLEGITAIHIDINKVRNSEKGSYDSLDLTPKSVTSCLIGLKSK